MRPWRITTALLGVGLLCAPAFAAGQAGAGGQAASEAQNYGQAAPPVENYQQYQNNVIPNPGTVNYVEGAVYLDGQPLGRNAVGSTQMAAGQVLQTHEGKAEILLNPGIYLRVNDHSTVKMISPYITPTQIAILRGQASVEVDQLLKQNVVQILDHGVTTQLVKAGYYEFNANDGRAMVFKGQAEVEYAPGKWAEIKGDHEMTLQQGVKENEAKFRPDPREDLLMQWSKLRSQYLAEANEQMAPEFYGPGFYPGWYWDPWMWDYTFIGAGPFYSPFGWGFYPLGWDGWGGFYGGFYGRGFGGLHGGFGGFHGGIGGGFHGGGRG